MDQAARTAQMVGAMEDMKQALAAIAAMQAALAVKKATREYAKAIANELSK